MIYVLDSNDRERISDAESELSRIIKMFDDQSLEHIPMLVYCNKQDLPNAMSVAECTSKLGLYSVCKNHTYYVQSACFTSGEGIYEGLDWLAEALKNKKPAPVSSEPAKTKPQSDVKTNGSNNMTTTTPSDGRKIYIAVDLNQVYSRTSRVSISE